MIMPLVCTGLRNLCIFWTELVTNASAHNVFINLQNFLQYLSYENVPRHEHFPDQLLLSNCEFQMHRDIQARSQGDGLGVQHTHPNQQKKILLLKVYFFRPKVYF